MLRTERVLLRTLKIFFYMQFIEQPDGIRIVWKFCPGQYGLGQVK